MPKCGDGKIDPGEQCDFGDTTSGDGCSANCQIEPCHEKNAGDLCDTGNDGIMDACCIEAGSAGTCWRSQSWSPFDANNDKVFDYCCPCAASFGSPPIFKVGGSVANSELVQTVECTGSPPPYPQDLKAFDCQGNGLTSSIKLVTDPTPTGIDVCDNDVDYERVWSVSSCGQTSFFTQNITVKDTTKPAVPDLTPREYSCFANVPVATKDVVTTKDTCAGEITGVHKSDTFPQNCGFTRVWTFADNCGNSVEGSVAIQIIDKEAPVVTKPSDASFQCLGDVPPVDDKSASATDNCGEVSMVGSASESFALTSSGGCLDRVITRQWTFKDPCDNQGTGTQLVTVKDTTPPAPPTPPKNETFACAADLDSQQVPNPGDAQDTCYGPIQPTYSSTRTDGSCRNKFTQNRTWTYTDKCGNSASISQQVVVNDDKPPVLPEGTVPKDVNIQCAAAFPPAQPLTALDNCDGSINIFPVDTTTPGSCANEVSFF
jgi:cysteine-rich repeat protein